MLAEKVKKHQTDTPAVAVALIRHQPAEALKRQDFATEIKHAEPHSQMPAQVPMQVPTTGALACIGTIADKHRRTPRTVASRLGRCAGLSALWPASPGAGSCAAPARRPAPPAPLAARLTLPLLAPSAGAMWPAPTTSWTVICAEDIESKRLHTYRLPGGQPSACYTSLTQTALWCHLPHRKLGARVGCRSLLPHSCVLVYLRSTPTLPLFSHKHSTDHSLCTRLTGSACKACSALSPYCARGTGHSLHS